MLSIESVSLCIFCMYLCSYFPKVFGPNEDAPLQESATRARFKALTNEVCIYIF